MPCLGLGTWLSESDACCGAVEAALQVGYRLVDTAAAYKNEAAVAAGLRRAGLQRSEVFLSTKLQMKEHGSAESVRAAARQALRRLDTEYVDLFLVHSPKGGNLLEVWPAMLEVRDQGLARAVGVSNFGVEQLEGLRRAGLELPEVNQIELHCWWQQRDVVEYHQSQAIATMAYSPLARGQRFGQTQLAEIAKELGRSEAEVAVRWSLQSGHVVIPKSVDPLRIRANAAEGFVLSEAHMAAIAKLDCGYRSCAAASRSMGLPWSVVSVPSDGPGGGGKAKGKGGKDSRGGKGRGFRPSYGGKGQQF